MVKLKFLTPMELGIFFKNFEGIAQNSNVDKSRIRRFIFERFIGQLEKGSNNGRPHYNLSVMTSCKVLTSTVIRELSLALYGVKNCNSISVEPTHDVNLLEKYCLKPETRFLHEIDGTLEELNNGRVEGFFAGRRIKFRIRRGIKIIVISNSPPVLKSLSNDRWQIKAIFKSVDGKDRIVQQAKVSSRIISVVRPFCTWQNVTETKIY